jgi:hypothetical protein
LGEEFPLECAACGGDIQLITFITKRGPIRKILTHLSEPLEPPPSTPARGSPTDCKELVQAHDDMAWISSGAEPTRENHVFPVSGMTRPSAGMGSRWRQQQAGDDILRENWDTVVLHARGDRSRAV